MPKLPVKGITWVFIFTSMSLSYAQTEKKSVVIGSMISKPNALLVLNPTDGDQGFLVPQLNSEQRNSLHPTSPDEDGLIIFDDTEKLFYYWKNDGWVRGLGDHHQSPVMTYDAQTQTLLLDSWEVDLSELKEIPDLTGMDNHFLFTDGTSFIWKPVSDFKQITSVVAGSGLEGGASSGDATLWVQTDQTSIIVNAVNRLEVIDRGISPQKFLPGAASTMLTTNSTGLVGWVSLPLDSDQQDLTMSGNTLILTNDGTPVDLSAIVITGVNINDGTIFNGDLANNSITTGKVLPGTPNTVLTTDAGGNVAWIASIVSSDAQDLVLSGNTLSLSNDGTSVDLNAVVAGGQVYGTLDNLLIGSNTITGAHLQNNTVTINKLTSSGIADAGKIYTTDAAGIPQLEQKNTFIASIAAGGDLGGNYPSPNVVSIQGNNVSPTALNASDNGKALVWNGTQWTPQLLPGVSALPKYLSIDPSDFTNLRRGDKKDKDNMVIFDDNSTFVTNIKRDEGAYIIAPVHVPDGATIQQVTLYYMDRDPSNIGFNLFRKTPTGANENVIATWTSTGSSPSIQSSLHTPVAGRETVDHNSYSYRIVVQLDPSTDTNDSSDATHRIYAVKIRYVQ